MEMLETRCLLASSFLQTNLVSDVPGLAAVTDGNLLNPWGLSASPTSPLWVSDNNGGVSTLYNGQGAIVPLVVTIPTATPGTLGSPSGTVFNSAGTGFDVVPGTTKSAIFLFDTEDGDIDAWAGGAQATVEVTNANAGYKGLAIGVDNAGDNLLYAANFAQNSIDVLDQNFLLVQGATGSSAQKSPIAIAGTFTDPTLPAGYAPFNIQAINGKLYVEYAKFDPTTTEGVPGAGKGFVDVFSADGVLLTPNHLISGGKLNAPWGVALAPSNFGSFSNDLLVGNFGDGHINAFDPTTGHFLGQLKLANGQAFQEDNLWALRFGNGATDKVTGNVLAPTNTLYFTAGINDQKDGLLGTLQVVATQSRQDPILPNLGNTPEQVVTTVASNGDLNPYGVAFVPQDIKPGGVLQPGDILVSNFNNSANAQGTGTTIVRISPDGQHSDFFDGAAGLGLTTALAVLKSGFVLVGNVPAPNGTAQQGSLLILDSNGKLVGQLSDSALLNGPWDLAVNDQGHEVQVFVSNVLSGTVTRIDMEVPKGGVPKVESETQIASGYMIRTDPNALVVGPTGLAFDPQRDVLYVASTGDNAIYAIPNAAQSHKDHGTGKLIVQDDVHLHGPLGLVIAPNGDLIAANGDAQNPDPNNPNELVEYTRKGEFVGQFQVDPGNGGGAFGIALSSADGELRFAAVDDNTNTLHVWTFGLTGESHHERHDRDDRGNVLAALFGNPRRHGIDDFFDGW